MRLRHCYWILFCPFLPAAAADSPDSVAYFESKVRPVLVEHCTPCHGEKKQKGGLRLDTAAGVKAGGESGPVLVAGKPDESRLIRAIRYDGDLQMPPDGKLPAGAVASLEAWVKAGAAFPAGAVASPVPSGKDHWAFQPIRTPTPPVVSNPEWVRTPVDAFVLAKLDDRGLAPSPAADKRTLLRRLTLDLTGLPPTYSEVMAFEADTSSDAYDRAVDRLLASPRYGERWARHWLDVARYADTKDGVLMFGDDRPRPYAYTYRDYVIRGLNDDLPFDRFVAEQLAADQLGGPPDRLAAMGFLTLGRMFDNNLHDVIDDRIDVVTRGFLGLTAACARCHDHKYDPISTRDYYALYGVFAGSEAPLVPPKLDPATVGPKAFEDVFAKAEKGLSEMLDKQFDLLSETARARTPDYLLHVATTPPDPMETAIFFLSLAPGDLRPTIVAKWRTYLASRKKDDPVFGPWVGADVAAGRYNPLIVSELKGADKTKTIEVAKAYGRVFSKVYDEAKRVPGPPDAARREILDVILGKDSPAYFPKGQTWKYMSRADKDAFGGKVNELDRLAVKEPTAPGRAMCLYDSTELPKPRVFVRGNPARPSDLVPRRFPSILGGTEFPHGSGRRDLADAITEPNNPLTARVLANRVWMHHFGEPLVDTPSDFGIRTPKPVQAELLDYLASSLRTHGWSLKHLHREIVRSNAYRQVSADRPDARKADPENRLVWRANPWRLEFEVMRDSMLFVSGRLDTAMFGRPVDVANDPTNRRRTVYGLVDRQSLPGSFRAFDFASPDQSAERRPRTTVPQQALFGLNSPFVLEQAKALAARPEVAGSIDPAAKVFALYTLILQRVPDPDEVKLGVAFAAAVPDPASKLGPWERFAQVLLLTNEFLFVD